METILFRFFCNFCNGTWFYLRRIQQECFDEFDSPEKGLKRDFNLTYGVSPEIHCVRFQGYLRALLLFDSIGMLLKC